MDVAAYKCVIVLLRATMHLSCYKCTIIRSPATVGARPGGRSETGAVGGKKYELLTHDLKSTYSFARICMKY